MEYQFIRQEPCREKVIFVLTLDRKKLKESVLIGTEDEVRSRLEGNEGAELACDTTNPLGTLLIRFDKDPEGNWNRLGLAPLRDAMHTNRWEQPALEQAAGKFLSGKYQSGEPICQYTAFRIWNAYLKAREKRRREIACEKFITEMARLTAAFRIENAMEYDPESGTPGRLDTRSLYYRRTPAEHTRLDLWFPDSSRRMECVAAYDSFLPLITYYLNRLSDWGLYFRQCKVCGKFFLAKSLRYELCSDKCRKKQALQNKREFDERARENDYDHQYKNECQGWRNVINKAKKTPGFPADRLARMQEAFEGFKKEALRRKALVKNKESSPEEFRNWIIMQKNLLLDIMDGS